MACLSFIVALAAFGVATAAFGQTMSQPSLKIHLVPQSRHPAPGMDTPLLVDVSPEKGWHIYWRNPGESGYAPRIDWKLPQGFTIAPLRHPAPVRMVLGGIAMNVHVGRTRLLTSLHVPATVTKGHALAIRGTADFLVCSDQSCMPVRRPLALDLTVGDGVADLGAKSAFAAARAVLPVDLGRPAGYALRADSAVLTLPMPWPEGATGLTLFSRNADGAAIPAARSIRQKGQSIEAVLPLGDWHPKGRLDLVARFDKDGALVRAVSLRAEPGTLPTARPPLSEDARVQTFLLALGGALLGGLLLNLMPCVFPILSLKAMALLRSGSSREDARIEAQGYLLGATAVMLALGGLMLALRSAGAAVGWAFQLQDPRVVAFLLLLIVAIAANLAGLFELPTPDVGNMQRRDFLGSVGTGALAAFIATPCTGPFMAGALGAALLLPPFAALAVFAGLGIGLALPFFAIAYSEPLRRLMPRPGAWMQTVRRLLSLPMFATALGLTWLLGRQAGVTGMTVGLAAALMLGLALWWWGLRQAAGKAMLPALVPAALAAVILIAGPIMPSPVLARSESRLLGAEPFDATRLAELRAAHKPVFLFATADWCLTCKVNEMDSLGAASVAEAFRRHGVTVMEADWTHNDPAITHFLAANDRAGVPLYLWYPAKGAPRTLPQLLTPQMLVGLTASPT